jgi:hypothetical protein
MVTIPESMAEMEKSLEWEFWATQGWTLHQTPDGQVMAVNVVEHRATKGAKRIEALVSRLARGTFSYKEFLSFKKLHTP